MGLISRLDGPPEDFGGGGGGEVPHLGKPGRDNFALALTSQRDIDLRITGSRGTSRVNGAGGGGTGSSGPSQMKDNWTGVFVVGVLDTLFERWWLLLRRRLVRDANFGRTTRIGRTRSG